ncbi:dihydrofolate reductase [Pediococcus siamensis]|uniref:dihydrofolate reductase n=1 Tax=Pediococcus siamensis TaxID=381829 RepID=UPI00399EF4E1
MLAFIWAEDQNGIIGDDNHLPWRIPDDTQYFKQITTGHTVVMGRKTFDSFGARPLPQRLNVILTRQSNLKETDNLKVSHSIHEILTQYDRSDRWLFIIGGKEVYAQFYPYVQRLYRTKIHAAFKGDTQMIPIDYSEWRLMQSSEGHGPEQNPIPHTFEVYEKLV